MSESKRIKGTSVAAFLFLPQFSLCFEGFAHIVPVFMRTLALMFAQSGLIPHNHPATRYGTEGVKKYRFSDLMGEAWFTLRTTRATPYQWGMFSAVVMMISTMACAVGTFFLQVFFNLGAAAQAQIFTHPGDPYAAGVGETGTNVVPTGYGSNILFDTRYSVDASAYQNSSIDYALMVLDKVLRQGAIGEGGATQSALQALMQVYNTGVLVVASIIIFWMILTIVLDTAKTGVVGGGRHNMVWAPMRIIFALGLMIPLGTAGFSSGQFAVMKLAEWGSNFGSRAWAAYVTSVNDTVQTRIPTTPKGAAAIASGITKIKVCQIAYNTLVYQTTAAAAGTPFYIRMIQTEPDRVTGMRTNTYTNTTDGNLCGAVTFQNAVALSDYSVSSFAYGMAAGGPLGAAYTGIATTLMNASDAYATDTFDEANAASAAVYGPAHQFACGFNRKRFSDGGSPTNPVDNVAANIGADGTGRSGCAGISSGCYAGTALSDGPPNCQTAMTNVIVDRLNASANGAITSINSSLNGVMMTELLGRGWGGMGLWYPHLVVMTKLARSSKKLSVNFSPGKSWTANDINLTDGRVLAIVEDYDRWWDGVIAAQVSVPLNALPPADVANKTRRARDLRSTTSGTGLAAEAKGVKAGIEGGGKSYTDKFVSWATDVDDEWFIFDVLDSNDHPVYPMLAVADAGQNIMGWGIGMVTLITTLQTVFGGSTQAYTPLGVGFTFTGAGLANSALANGLAAVAMSIMLAGMVITYYIPTLPLLRVTFAVLTWIISVFEAVCMVPIAALAHLTSEGEGLAGGAKQAWILWLNVLMRPVLVVLGFVGAMLVYNTFIVYFHISFASFASINSGVDFGFIALLSKVAYTIIYMAVMYTSANVIFKMLDTLPNAMIRYMGGSHDPSFDQDNSEGMLIAGSNIANRFKRSPYDKTQPPVKDKTGTQQA